MHWVNADVYKWSELEGEYISVGPGSALREVGGVWDVRSP